MTDQFFDKPILNSPYAYPARHWELDPSGQPTNRIVEQRRRAEFITPIPKPRKRSKRPAQEELVFNEAKDVSSDKQRYETMSMVNEVRQRVDAWRKIPNASDWHVSPETARLLHYWRHHQFSSIRPFFCQVEAVETAIWISEVAPQLKEGARILEYLEKANNDANPGLSRLALKLATGAGKTTVMAMIIAWHTINAVRRPNSKKFTRGFLIVTPGLTIKDRLRVLQSNDPDSYYKSRELVPSDMLADLDRAKIVITNYHAFKLHETMELSAGGRALLEGRVHREVDEINTIETEGQMLQRVMPDLMGMKSILVLNDDPPCRRSVETNPRSTPILRPPIRVYASMRSLKPGFLPWFFRDNIDAKPIRQTESRAVQLTDCVVPADDVTGDVDGRNARASYARGKGTVCCGS